MIEQLHELPEDARDCPVCGGTMEEMGGQTEDAEEISVVERRFVVVRQQRRKYRCRCNACVVTAPGPPKLQPGDELRTPRMCARTGDFISEKARDVPALSPSSHC